MKRLIALTIAACLLLAVPASAAPKFKYAVALGDSFSAGVQPGVGMKDSFSYPKVSYTQQMLSRASRLLRFPLKLEMLACGGATTDSMVGREIKPCSPGVGGFKLPYANTSARTSQLRYALQFMREHRGQIAFVTMTIGGNDLLRCVDSTTGGFDINCINSGLDSTKANIPPIARAIHRAAGRGTPLIASGYFDPYLQFILRTREQAAIGQASIAIQRQLNDAIEEAYAAAGSWKFVRVDDLFGTYIPLDQTTNLDPYGQIPVAVANVCKYSWMCAPPPEGPNIHPNKAGYALYARDNLKALRAEP
jgi:lysophospholipase L1-like esterase